MKLKGFADALANREALGVGFIGGAMFEKRTELGVWFDVGVKAFINRFGVEGWGAGFFKRSGCYLRLPNMDLESPLNKLNNGVVVSDWGLINLPVFSDIC